MLELIVLVNLVFSICGFVFIVRMWKEVKARRDYYGEHFGIKRGADRVTGKKQPVEPVQGFSAEQLTALSEYMNNKQPDLVNQQPVSEVPGTVSDGDLQKIVNMVMAAQREGA